MSNALFTDAPNKETLAKDVRTLADDTVQAARHHLVEPALDAAKRVGAYSREALHESREMLAHQASRVEHQANDQYERSVHWVSAHPLAALGIAFAVGIVINKLTDSVSKR
jgi:ElaB/YqjD/DUF883 family membrane-anchored ribosome-binding protein